MALIQSTAIPSGATGYEIDQSVRLETITSGYLDKTFSSAGNQKTFTWSFWLKRANHQTYSSTFINCGANGGAVFRITLHNSSGKLTAYDYQSSGGMQWILETNDNARFRDFSGWYHIVVAYDSTQSTNTDRCKIFVNGQDLIGNYTNNYYPGLNYDSHCNGAVDHLIGATTALDGNGEAYFAEVHFLDGVRKLATDFGETGDYGEWKPIAYSGSYGSNGFYLDYADASALGNDVSGNNNDFAVNGIAASDQMLDSPTNNFCTINPISFGPAMTGDAGTSANFLKEGNLHIKPEHNEYVVTTMMPTSGKWYVEALVKGTSPYGPMLGWTTESYSTTSMTPQAEMWKIYSRGASSELYWYDEAASGVTLASGSFAVGEIIQFAWDCDTGKAWFGRDEDWYDSSLGTTGNPATGANPMLTATASQMADNFGIFIGSGDEYGGDTEGSQLVMNFGQDSSFAGNKTAQGNQDDNDIADFYYDVPAGFMALCTSNLPDVAVIPSEHFNTVLWGGTSASHAITGVGFQPDLSWLKHRNHGTAHQHNWFDAVRGTNKTLHSNSTEAEESLSDVFNSFDADGFTVGNNDAVNDTGVNYVGWNWKAGTSVSGNSSGSGTAQSYTGSVNTDAGFSIIKYTGNGTDGMQVPHHLGVVPDAIFIKSLTTASWQVFLPNAITAEHSLQLDNTGAQGGPYYSTHLSDTMPTTSLVTLGNGAMTNTFADGVGQDYIMYCWANKDGYSKAGKYTGNGNADGTFVYTGFRPAYLLVKQSSASGERWYIFDNKRDTYNYVDTRLVADDTNVETTGATQALDFVSNGFKARYNQGAFNTSGATYIYIAFAETPFKYSNAR